MGKSNLTQDKLMLEKLSKDIMEIVGVDDEICEEEKDRLSIEITKMLQEMIQNEKIELIDLVNSSNSGVKWFDLENFIKKPSKKTINVKRLLGYLKLNSRLEVSIKSKIRQLKYNRQAEKDYKKRLNAKKEKTQEQLFIEVPEVKESRLELLKNSMIKKTKELSAKKEKIEKEIVTEIPEVKESKLQKIKNFYKNTISSNLKQIVVLILSGAICVTSLLANLTALVSMFSIGLSDTLLISLCYLLSSAMSGFIFKEEVNKIKNNNNNKQEQDKSNDMVKTKEVEMKPELVNEKNSIKVKSLNNIDVPTISKSKLVEFPKLFENKPKKMTESKQVEEKIVKEKPVKVTTSRISKKTKKSNIWRILSIITFSILSLVLAGVFMVTFPMGILYSLPIVSMVSGLSIAALIGSLYKIYRDAVSIVNNNLQSSYEDLEEKLEEIEIEKLSEKIIKNLDISSVDVSKVELTKEEKIGQFKENNENLIQIASIRMLSEEEQEALQKPKTLLLNK